jgi:hypothetical protein
MKRTIVIAGAAALVSGFTPLTSAQASSSHAGPKAVAWQMKTLMNKNLKFNGSTLRIRSMVCAGRGYPQYICKAVLTDGTRFAWPTVVYKDDGSLRARGGYIVQ